MRPDEVVYGETQVVCAVGIAPACACTRSLGSHPLASSGCVAEAVSRTALGQVGESTTFRGMDEVASLT
jgi:hypothetical protein